MHAASELERLACTNSLQSSWKQGPAVGCLLTIALAGGGVPAGGEVQNIHLQRPKGLRILFRKDAVTQPMIQCTARPSGRGVSSEAAAGHTQMTGQRVQEQQLGRL